MIDAAVRIVDRLVQLLTVREKNRERYLNNVIEPMYRDAESVAKDYTNLFGELLHRLQTAEDVPTVIKWLEERRLELLPVRMKIRALLRHEPPSTPSGVAKSFERFQRGVWGVMKGGMSLVEEGHTPRDYGGGDHTVLDLLYLWSQVPIAGKRDHYLRNARAQLASIERAWADVVEGYAEIKQCLS